MLGNPDKTEGCAGRRSCFSIYGHMRGSAGTGIDHFNFVRSSFPFYLFLLVFVIVFKLSISPFVSEKVKRESD